MKTKILSHLFLLTLMVLSVACGKKDDDNKSSTTHQFATLNGGCYDYTDSVYVAPSNCSATGYYWSNGACLSSATGQAVSTAYCSNSATNPGYYYSNGNCYSVTTNQIAPVSYCSNSATSGQCFGNYIYSNAGYMQMVTCNGANCRGYTLIEAATGRQVTCQ